MKVKVFDRQGHLVGPVEMSPIVKSDAAWQKQLTAERLTRRPREGDAEHRESNQERLRCTLGVCSLDQDEADSSKASQAGQNDHTVCR